MVSVNYRRMGTGPAFLYPSAFIGGVQDVDHYRHTARLMKAEAGTTPIPEAWSPTGQTLAFSLYKPNNIFSLWILSRDDKKPLPFAEIGRYIARGTFSPDGHWIAYQSDETGQPEIFVQPFPPGGKYQISKDGGRHPLWSPDGKELFLNAGVGIGKLSAVKIATQPGFTFSNPVPIPLEGIIEGIAISGRNYDITPDGKYFIVVTLASQTQTARGNLQQVQLILNWFEELKQRVPVR